MDIINRKPYEHHEPELRNPYFIPKKLIADRYFLCLKKGYRTKSPRWFVWFAVNIFLINLFLLFSCANPLITQIAEPKTITFETNGGSTIEEQIVYRNYPVVKPQSPVKDNFIFDDWYIENENFETPWNFSAIPSGSITLYANWTPIYTYTVTFDKNGGDTDSDPQSVTVMPGSLITAPDVPPVKDGFGFAGWYTEAECITKWDFAQDVVTDNITLYALWIHNCVTISLSMEELINKTPQLESITISRAGTGGVPIKALVSVNEALFDAGSISWRISGVGAYAGTFITDDNDPVTGSGEFMLNAEDERYNAPGAHTLLLEVKIDGIAYQTNIIFTVIN